MEKLAEERMVVLGGYSVAVERRESHRECAVFRERNTTRGEREIWQRREGGCDRKGRWTGGRGLERDQKKRK